MQQEGYSGGYSDVQRYVKAWKKQYTNSPSIKQAFIPLFFPPGETCQFDWSQDKVGLGGIVQTIKVAHFRLAYSRQMFVIAYPRETQEMVLDAHKQAFAFFGGVSKRLVYDNLKTVVDAIFVGKERRFNRRLLTLANHYLFEPIACTPSSGSENDKVENQVGNIREWLFTPRAKLDDFITLNEHSRCVQRDQLICDLWRYLSVLDKKPSTFRHGVPFVNWDLPVAIKIVRDRILKQEKGDRAFVDLLLMTRDLGDDGLDVLEVACDLTIQTGVISAAIVLNEMRRLTDTTTFKTLNNTPASIPILTVEPTADCHRYDNLRRMRHVH